MEKYAYATLITDKFYLEGAKALDKRLKFLNSNYPLIVMVTNNIYHSIANEMEDLNVEVVPYFTLPKVEHYFKDTVNKFAAFLLKDYDKIIFLDADLFPIQHFDDNFDYEFDTLQCFTRSATDDHIHGGLFILKPRESEYYNILKLVREIHFENDEEILEYLYGTTKFNNYRPCEFKHYGGRMKYWCFPDYDSEKIVSADAIFINSFFEYVNTYIKNGEKGGEG